MAEIPETVEGCDSPDCEEELNLLANYLTVTVKPKRSVLVQRVEPSADPNVVPEDEVFLGTKSGRGVMLKFHNFDCFADWVAVRKGLEPVLEFHAEDEIYEPEDNRSPEQLVADGEMHPALATALSEMSESEEGGEG